MRNPNHPHPAFAVSSASLFALLFAVVVSAATAQEKPVADPAADPKQDPKVSQDKFLGCNPDKVSLACPVPIGKPVTLPVARRTYKFNYFTCLPDNSRPGNSVIKAMLDQCPVPDKCKKELPSRVDGCSVPPVLAPQREEIQELFGAACVGHDLCYNNNEAKKSYCDQQLKTNMFAICDVAFTKPGPLWGNCAVQAEAVYEAVSAFARSSYDDDQKWAKKHCANK
jgi:hypothetical protein